MLIRRFPLSPDELPQDSHAKLIRRCIEKSPEGGVSMVRTQSDEWILLDVGKRVRPRRVILVKVSSTISTTNMDLIEGLDRIYSTQVAQFDHRERDPHTYLLNRKSMEVALNDIISFNRGKKFHEQTKRTWLAVVNVDEFNKVNEEFGYLYGDKVLLQFAHLLNKSFRYTDYLFRYGADGFAVIINSCSATDAQIPLENFRKTVEAYPFSSGSITASIGYTLVDPIVSTNLLLEFAERKNHVIKSKGKNKVSYFNSIKDVPSRGSSVGHIELS